MSEQEASLTENPDLIADDDYAGVRGAEQTAIPAPELPYRPAQTAGYNPGIALIGCGGITGAHLEAYRKAGYNVVAFCDLDAARATERRDSYYPDGAVTTDYMEILRRDDVDVVDVATHPAARVEIIAAALQTGKHVLSQKPFVLDLDDGARLVELADKQGVKLAVNQNGRWASHIAYMRQAIAAGILGEVVQAEMSVSFDHSWVVGTPFDDMYDLVLYDFAIHWFDMLTCYFPGQTAERVFASVAYAKGQRPRPPLLSHVLVDYPAAQATLSFNAATPYGHQDRTYIVGTGGTAYSTGPGLNDQTLQITTADGMMQPDLVGSWFNDGFHGAMAELLVAIEEKRTPYHHAAENLDSLALAFAAISSAHTGEPKRPGEVRRLPEKSV